MSRPEVEEYTSEDWGFRLQTEKAGIDLFEEVDFSQEAAAKNKLQLLDVGVSKRLYAASNCQSVGVGRLADLDSKDTVKSNFASVSFPGVTTVAFDASNENLYVLANNSIHKASVDDILTQKPSPFEAVHSEANVTVLATSPITDNAYLYLDNTNTLHIIGEHNSSVAGISAISWSADGTQIAAISDSTLKIISTDGKELSSHDIEDAGSLISVSTINENSYYVVGSLSDDTDLIHLLVTVADQFSAEEMFLAPPFGSVERSPTVYTSSIREWRQGTAFSFLSYSLGTEISTLECGTNTRIVSPSNDTDRAELPMNDDGDDTLPVGLALDYTGTDRTIVAPCPAIEEAVGVLPRLLCLNSMGNLLYWDIFDIHGVRDGAVSLQRALDALPSSSSSQAGKETKVATEVPTEPTKASETEIPGFGGLNLQKSGTKTTESSQGFGQSGFGAVSQSTKPESSAFGSSGFGNTSTEKKVDAKPAFGSSGFGSTPAAQSAFGSSGFGSSSGFGKSSSSESSAKPAFGSTGLVDASKPSFGSAENTTASKPAFGSSGFGSSSQKSAFGSTGFGTTASKPAFGSSSFGNTSSSDSSSSKPAFGSSGFGNTSSKPAFGSTSFGGDATKPAFGSTGFGNNTESKPAFGSSGFGSSSKPISHNPTGSSFGSNTQFGNKSSNASPFAGLGGSSQSTSSPFAKFGEGSQSKASPFGSMESSNSKSIFGSSDGSKPSPFGSFGKSDTSSPFGQKKESSSNSPFASLMKDEKKDPSVPTQVSQPPSEATDPESQHDSEQSSELDASVEPDTDVSESNEEPNDDVEENASGGSWESVGNDESSEAGESELDEDDEAPVVSSKDWSSGGDNKPEKSLFSAEPKTEPKLTFGAPKKPEKEQSAETAKPVFGDKSLFGQKTSSSSLSFGSFAPALPESSAKEQSAKESPIQEPPKPSVPALEEKKSQASAPIFGGQEKPKEPVTAASNPPPVSVKAPDAPQPITKPPAAPKAPVSIKKEEIAQAPELPYISDLLETAEIHKFTGFSKPPQNPQDELSRRMKDLVQKADAVLQVLSMNSAKANELAKSAEVHRRSVTKDDLSDTRKWSLGDLDNLLNLTKGPKQNLSPLTSSRKELNTKLEAIVTQLDELSEKKVKLEILLAQLTNYNSHLESGDLAKRPLDIQGETLRQGLRKKLAYVENLQGDISKKLIPLRIRVDCKTGGFPEVEKLERVIFEVNSKARAYAREVSAFEAEAAQVTASLRDVKLIEGATSVNGQPATDKLRLSRRFASTSKPRKIHATQI